MAKITLFSAGVSVVSMGLAFGIAKLFFDAGGVFPPYEPRSQQKASIEKVVQEEDYKPFITIDTLNHAYTSPSVVSGDFDGDSDLDLIVGVNEAVRKRRAGFTSSPYNINLYQFRSDGKGNFTLYTPESETRVSE